MTLAETIRKMGPPIPSHLHPNERAPVEQGAAPAERKQGKSMFGDDGGGPGSFQEYFGSGVIGDKEAGRYRDQGGKNGSRLGASDSFREEAEKMKHTPHVVPRSRFGMPSRQMAKEYPGSKGFEHEAFCEQAAAFVKADNQEAFNGMMAKASPEELKDFNKFLDAQKG